MSFIDFTKTKINEAIQLGLKERDVRQLVNRYGSNIDFIFEKLKSLRINKTDNGLPELLEAQILYTIEHEMCLTPSDFFVRRTGLLYFDIDQVKKNKLAVIGYLNKFFSWDNTLTKKLTNDLDNEINEAGLSSIFDPQPVDSKP
jgi:glycerol-3-phosphate dehydrogenase